MVADTGVVSHFEGVQMVDLEKGHAIRMAELERTSELATNSVTLRDYFAARALDTMAKMWQYEVADRYEEEMSWDDDDWWFIAKKSYIYADAMLAARRDPRHIFTEEMTDEELAQIPEGGIDIIIKEAFGV